MWLDYAGACPAATIMRQVSSWVFQVFERSGANPRMGPELQRLYQAAGLVDIRLSLYAPMGGAADWAGYEVVVGGVRSCLPLLETYGIATAEQVEIESLSERIRAEAEAVDAPVLLLPHVSAWARKSSVAPDDSCSSRRGPV
jgi:hypothetical protein